MGLGRSQTYDRARILEAASQARSRKKREKAISLYRWVLAVERHNGDLHAKLAPLLAETGQHFDAWTSFRACAHSYLREGLPDRAAAVYREATHFLPQELEAWQALARMQQKRGMEREAVETLIEASRQFRSRWRRPQAIHLLRVARELDTWNFEATYELARLLARSAQRPEAWMMLEGLAARTYGRRQRRVRGAMFALSPGLRRGWNWLRAAVRPDVVDPAEPERRSQVLRLRTRQAR